MKSILWAFFIVFTIGHSQAQVISTFDVDPDGWTFFDPVTVTVNHIATGGNPGGYANAGYTSNTSANQAWRAPAKFLGNQVARSLGMNLRFDMRVGVTGTNSFTQGDVVITNAIVNISLVYSLPSKPGTAWTSYALRLDETLGWRIGNISGTPATRAQIISVLSNITEITLRGTYASFSPNSSSIDNVILEQRTFLPPIISSIAPLAALPGTSVTITGNNFDPTIVNNTVYVGNVTATITNASATSLTITVPANSQYGRITVANEITGLAKQSEQNFNPLFAGGGRVIPSSFKSNFTLDVAGGFGGLSLADMDGDGWADIVAAAKDNSAIRVFRNLAAGGTLSTSSFAAPVSFATSLFLTNGSGLTTVDFDNDGKLDMATSGWTGGPGGGVFATFRNISTPGNLAFETVERWSGLSDESPVNAAADVDGDGLIDLVSGEGSGGTWITQNISTPGNIEFSVSQAFFGSSSHAGATLGDLNGDGKPEFILKSSNQIVYTNTSTPGSISFGANFTLPVGIQGNMIVFDFNQDGKNDLAWKDGNSNNDIRIRLNTSTGGTLSLADFSTEVILDSETSNFGGASLGDINGDGKADILATDSDTPAVFENVFSGGAFDANAFIPAHRFPGIGSFTYPIAPQAADLNGDGKPDMVVGFTNSSPNRIVIYENQNVVAPHISVTTVTPLAGPIGSTVTITGSGFSPNAAENFVYFGAVRANVSTASSTSLTVLVPPGASYTPVSVRVGELSSTYHLPFKTTFSAGVTFNSTHFAPPVAFPFADANDDIDVIDIDTDGKPDIAAETTTQRAFFFRNTHLLGPITTSSLTAAGSTVAGSATNIKFSDVDGNGLAELIGTQGQLFPNNSTPGSVSFGTGVTGLPFFVTATAAFADFNLDGKIDLAATESNQLVVNENRSVSGTLTAAGAFGSFANSISFARPSTSFGGGLVAGDFDADGYADAIALNSSANTFSIFRNNKAPRISTASFAARVDVGIGVNPARAYTGDFDLDGKLDFVVHYGTGANAPTVSVFHNQSSGGSISFNRIDLTNPSATTVAHIADLDGDGRPEIITNSETGNRFSIFKNIYTGGALTAASFAAPFNTTVTAPRGLHTADLNLDGKPEIILTRAVGLLLVYENLIPSSSINITTQPAGGNFCNNAPATLTIAASGTTNITYQWQRFDTVLSTFQNLVESSGYSGVATATLSINLPFGASAGDFRCVVQGDFAPSVNSATVTVTAIAPPAAPATTGVTICAGSTATLTASGGTAGQYRWYTVSTGGTAIAGQTNSTFTTPVLSTSTDFYVAINNGSCESSRSVVTAAVNPAPAAPSGTGANRCGPGSVTLNASGGTAGQYRWYTAATGGTAITGETNATFTTPSLTANTDYFVAISTGSCESTRTAVTATVSPIPAKPVISASGPLAFCSGQNVTLTAPAGFTYLWSNNATTQQITVSTAGSFTVVVSAGGCASVASDPAVVVVTNCTTNQPPAITATTSQSPINGKATISLAALLSDPDNNLDLSTLRIVSPPRSGATASIGSGGILTVNYQGLAFSGTDELTIEICDLAGLCVQQRITIEVIGDILVYNGLSPNGDGQNDVWVIEYINLVPDARENEVSIYNRWGDLVWEGTNYDNAFVAFRGLNRNGNELPSGTYFYKIQFTSRPLLSGFLALRR